MSNKMHAGVIMDFDPEIGVRYCETFLRNSDCPYIAHGCTGCMLDKRGAPTFFYEAAMRNHAKFAKQRTQP